MLSKLIHIKSHFHSKTRNPRDSNNDQEYWIKHRAAWVCLASDITYIVNYNYSEIV